MILQHYLVGAKPRKYGDIHANMFFIKNLKQWKMINKQIVADAHTQISGIVMLLIITVPPDGECGTKNIDRTNEIFF